MTINYAAIKAGDTGEADVNDALATMSAQTVDTFPETMVTYISIANSVSFAASAEVALKVSAAIQGGLLPQWVDTALNTVGIDVNNAETAGLLTQIQVTVPTITALTNLGKVATLKFPGLKLGHLMYARTI